ncbi:hypothetical protein [Chryseobacterium sp. CFBP8996]|uniref:hypothetical protein n=1 Tax=Chryseobacterium sp. CFBP8996 TaxID=3096529 RepID=UPI002A6A01AB|nr:hypothetical protein [Chryseobacterium sp. CFBP8996]MDY0933346.1 hypothetical protein [Chryseobacterium sp. CFBP8996]
MLYSPISGYKEVIEFRDDTGGGIPPMGLNPCGDPFGGGCGGGGSGDDGYEYPEPPTNTPCEKIAEIGKHNTTKSLFENLKPKTNSTKEYGEILKESGGQIGNTSIEGEVGQGGMDLNFSGGPIDGFIHSHYTSLLSVFSPGDLASLAALYATGNIKDVNTFIMGVVTASNTQYIMVIDDPDAFAAFAQQFLLPNGQINDTLTDLFGIIQYGKYNIKDSNLSTTNELGFLKLLDDKNSGIKVLKGSNNSNSWAELKIKNGQIDPIPCN